MVTALSATLAKALESVMVRAAPPRDAQTARAMAVTEKPRNELALVGRQAHNRRDPR